jgi:hypothetical protein
MDLATLQDCHRRALAAAGRLRLPLRSRVWKGQAGEFSGGGTGSSLDFQDHRAYSPGDDPRHINWQAYARTGHYSMKLYREEVRPVVDLILDGSESMFFEPAKARRSAELFYLAAESARAAGASLACHATRGEQSLALAPDELTRHSWLDTLRRLPATTPALPPDLSRIPLRANAIRVWISDLLFAADPEPILRGLGQRHGSTILLCPFLTSEARPDWDGPCDFIDPETGARHPHRIEAPTLQRYRKAYDNHFAWWKSATRSHQCAFARIPAEGELTTHLILHALPAGALETTA